ncbi:MOSC domain-containing protein YiiM [Maribacter sedimenticola]|uniref:MOSC domain-containing protein YiiM n=1 Tax=Maribacter sedimenticola TaxID=228956 RepID=A0ABY1SMD3_9FLAO|nr:MOSC domain-containing protein [Maribacter sedimenticola]SNR76621.1 MOSC domain-containing protein YiiM [Maribacter sedimenticola]
MKVVSTNIGTPVTFEWNGKKEQTGIFKYPTENGLFLGKNDVQNDTVIDRVHHAGTNKACYLFSAEQYGFWKPKYPNLSWNWGMFGENLTISGLDESEILVGNIYRIGKALVQVTQPREPCYKLGVRFNDVKIIKDFIAHNHPGTYVKVIEEGRVTTGDSVILEQASTNTLSVQNFYQLLYDKEKNKDMLALFMSNDAVPLYKKEKFKKFLS